MSDDHQNTTDVPRAPWPDFNKASHRPSDCQIPGMTIVRGPGYVRVTREPTQAVKNADGEATVKRKMTGPRRSYSKGAPET